MNQISLFCPRCLRALKMSEYSGLISLKKARQAGCIFCGEIFYSSDIDEPNYLKSLFASCQGNIDFDVLVYRLCAVTGRRYREVKQFIESNNLKPSRVEELIRLAAIGKWKFDDEQ